ncbi:helix-turn-helix transcriptional regulator [Halomicrococcus sp. NG-SE-24]|uniref:helix-turn-helix transcriptional regulator n=1 Tax=Halomicrococcus sp. NG-SE-24 TaxID=3436928 RepID=UPI003D973EAF
MDTPLEDIRFLADSENRFVALESLASGPCTRSELRSATESSKATISRLLGDFERQGWVAKEGNRYALTPLGDYVATIFVDLYDHMKTAHELRDLLPWFPLGELDREFDLEILADASVTAATPENPMAPVARVLEIERESTWTYTLANRFPKACIEARYEAMVEGNQTCELVLTPSALESAMTSPNANKFEEIVAADQSSVYLYDGDIGPGGIYDGTAYLIVANEEDVNVGLIESDDPALIERLETTFNQYREASTQLTVSSLEADAESIQAET